MEKSPNKSYKFGRISSEFKDCSLPYTCDQYTRCSYGCQYCFGVQFQKCNPSSKKSPELKTANAKNTIELLTGQKPDNPYYKNFISKRFVLHWGGLTEPFCLIEKKYGVGLEIMKTLRDLKYPTLFSSKGYSTFLDIPKYRNIFEANAKYKNFAFQFSIVSNDDKTSLLLEPNTPTTSDRFKAMKILSDLGYLCILRWRPFVVGVSDIGLEDMLQRAKDNGAKGISLEFFALDERVVPQLGDRLAVMDNLTGLQTRDYYKKLSPKERGTYMRLNRDVKEEYVKRIYIKCRKLGLSFGCSDPDYKELNDTGCCCNLPENYPENPELTNWSRGQITYHLKELRKRYWKSGGIDKYLKFEDVEKSIFNNWMNEHKYYNDSIKYWQVDYTTENSGHILEFRESWNNLNSPDNPYKHYHGILKPISVDNRNLIVYEYTPQAYESRWKREGIL
jgi:DNA repair photolyase